MYKYLFGSKLYGLTNNKSDEDYLIVFNTNSEKDEYIKNTNNKDEECWTWQEFKSKLESHDLKALEVYYANVGNVGTHLFINCEEYQFRLNLQQLRKAVSAVVSNAHVKAKKKFKTKTPLFYGRRYEAGEEIQLDEQEAKELLEGEIVKEV